MDSFSEEMTQKKAAKNGKNITAAYQPSDEEINKKLARAKNLNKNIFKDTHPEEYQRQLDEEAAIKKKELEEKKKKEEEDRQYS